MDSKWDFLSLLPIAVIHEATFTLTTLELLSLPVCVTVVDLWRDPKEVLAFRVEVCGA